MKIWKVKKSEVLEVLMSKGIFYVHRYKYSHDKARKIMKQFVKEGIASYLKNKYPSDDLIYIKLLDKKSIAEVQPE